MEDNTPAQDGEATQPVVPPTHEEVKSILQEVVEEITSDKTRQEAIEKLVNAVDVAKSDFMQAIARVEETLKQLGINRGE